MERKIKFDDIVVFVKKAINNNLNINTEYRDLEKFEEYKINIVDDDKSISFYLYETNELYLISRNNTNGIRISLTDIDKLKFKTLVLEVSKYSENLTLNYFNNFFKEDSKPTDINDLDNEDD